MKTWIEFIRHFPRLWKNGNRLQRVQLLILPWFAGGLILIAALTALLNHGHIFFFGWLAFGGVLWFLEERWRNRKTHSA